MLVGDDTLHETLPVFPNRVVVNGLRNSLYCILSTGDLDDEYLRLLRLTGERDLEVEYERARRRGGVRERESEVEYERDRERPLR